MSTLRETMSAPAAVVAPRPLAIATFLLPVAAVVVMSICLLRGDAAVTAGVADLDPLYGLTPPLIGVASVAIGLGNLVLAAAYCFRSDVALRTGVAVAGAAWTAGAGGLFSVFMAVSTAADPTLVASRTAGDQVPWQVAAVVVAVLPLLAALVVHRAARHDAMF